MTDLDALRASYDRVADAYVGMQAGDLGPHPWLRAVLGTFAEEVRDLGPVLDVGCGPGQVSAHLAGLGVDVSGVDLSPRMVEHARRDHPDLRFEVASATALRPAPGSLGGVLAWWSLFHLPRATARSVLAVLADALVPGGQLVWGTHVGDGEVHRTDAYGVDGVTWTTYLWQPEEMADALAAAGLEPVVELRFPPLWTARPRPSWSPAGPGDSGRRWSAGTGWWMPTATAGDAVALADRRPERRRAVRRPDRTVRDGAGQRRWVPARRAGGAAIRHRSRCRPCRPGAAVGGGDSWPPLRPPARDAGADAAELDAVRRCRRVGDRGGDGVLPPRAGCGGMAVRAADGHPVGGVLMCAAALVMPRDRDVPAGSA